MKKTVSGVIHLCCPYRRGRVWPAVDTCGHGRGDVQTAERTMKLLHCILSVRLTHCVT